MLLSFAIFKLSNMNFSELAEYYNKLEQISSRLAMIDILTDMFKKASKEEIRPIIYLTQGVLSPPFEGLETGIAEKFAEEAIARATGYSREIVEDEFKKTGDLGLVAEKFVKEQKIKKIETKPFSIIDVFNTFRKIASISGEGSQKQKIDLLSGLIANANPLEARYIVRFALGELRLGVGDATILEALSKAVTGSRDFKEKLEQAYNICSDLGKVGEVFFNEGKEGIENFKIQLFSPIRPALAERLPSGKEIMEKMGGIASVESKYDGFRAQVHIDKEHKRVEIFSRNLERSTPMLPDIVEAVLKELDIKNAILDGEAIAYNESVDEFHPFQETITRKRKHGVEKVSEELPLYLFAFDILYLNNEPMIEKPYKERREKLEKIVSGKGRIRVTDRIIAKSPEELEKYFDEVIEKGLEGIVAKDLNAPYVAGARKFTWIKLKRSYKGELSDTLDLVIVGYYLGKGSRAEFQFGGLLCAVYNEERDMFETITKIGTGFTEEMMKDLKEKLEKIRVNKKPARVDSLIEPDFWVEPKYVVTVRADEITKSPLHTAGKGIDGSDTGYALRFPRIVSNGIRPDKGPNEATTTKEVIEMYKMQKKIEIKDNT